MRKIDGYSNNLEEDDKDEKKTIDREFTEQRSYSENNQNAINFRLSDVQRKNEENISKAYFIESI